MKFYELIALVWILAGLTIALTWLILRHRRAQARTALEVQARADLKARTDGLDG